MRRRKTLAEVPTDNGLKIVIERNSDPRNVQLFEKVMKEAKKKDAEKSEEDEGSLD